MFAAAPSRRRNLNETPAGTRKRQHPWVLRSSRRPRGTFLQVGFAVPCSLTRLKTWLGQIKRAITSVSEPKWSAACRGRGCGGQSSLWFPDTPGWMQKQVLPPPPVFPHPCPPSFSPFSATRSINTVIHHVLYGVWERAATHINPLQTTYKTGFIIPNCYLQVYRWRNRLSLKARPRSQTTKGWVWDSNLLLRCIIILLIICYHLYFIKKGHRGSKKKFPKIIQLLSTIQICQDEN